MKDCLHIVYGAIFQVPNCSGATTAATGSYRLPEIQEANFIENEMEGNDYNENSWDDYNDDYNEVKQAAVPVTVNTIDYPNYIMENEYFVV